MIDLFDQQITESLHHSAAHATPRPGSFSDVRRRVRVRRQRHVAAAVLPAVAGMAWLGMRPTTTPSGSAAAPGASDSAPVSSEPAADTAVTDSPAHEPVTTLPIDTVSSAVINTTPSCAITGAEALVPNVAGMPYADAVAALASAGLEPNALREFPPPGENARDADHAVVRQNTAPGTLASCGTIVDVTVAYRPGILYIVQEGDTYESIATSQGITLDQLLGFSGLTVAKLELAGQDSSAPLALGQALRLSNSPATLNTVPTTTA